MTSDSGMAWPLDRETLETESDPSPSANWIDGHVLRGAVNIGIRWQPGERLEHLFERRADDLRIVGRSDALAVDGPAGRLTYDELDRRANRLARHLVGGRGIQPGDRVGVL